jgi:hypothetical protein
MAHVFTFTSARFHPANEPANPINPIAGHAALTWLCKQLAQAGFECGTPDAEDWGWYTHVLDGNRTYLLGASGEWPESGASTEWTIQLELRRSLWDRLSGTNKMTPNDPVSLAIERALRGHTDNATVTVEREP